MDATTAVSTSATVVGVALAKSVFQLSVADAFWRVVMKACGANNNKATCAQTNEPARICYACLRDGEVYGAVPRQEKTLTRTTYALPGCGPAAMNSRPSPLALELIANPGTQGRSRCVRRR